MYANKKPFLSSLAKYLSSYFEGLRPLFHAYFLKLGEEETLPQLVRINIISCVFALYGNLLLSESILPEFVIFGKNFWFKNI